jgi:membrane protein
MRTIVVSVDVDRPLREVYDQWTCLEDLPAVMPGVVGIRQLDERTTAWDVLVWKEHRSFDARTLEQVADQRISWETVGGTQHSGVVTFHPTTAGPTRVTVQLDWVPGGLFDRIADRLGILERHIRRDLEAFRRHVEKRVVPAEGWRGTIRSETDPGGRRRGPDEERGTEMAPSRSTSDDIDLRGESGDDSGGGDDRGRRAESPTDIPASGWKDILKRANEQRKEDNVQIISAGVAFYLFLAMVPTLIATISVYGLVADPADVEEQLAGVTEALPEAAGNLVLEQVESVAATGNAGLGISLLIAVAGALWSASKGMQALVIALNIAYNEPESRGFVKLRGLALGLTLGLIVAAIVGVGGMVLVSTIAGDLGGAAGWVIEIVRWPLLGIFVMAGLAVLYRYAPDREKAEWKWVSPGAVLAVVVLLVASIGFSLYVNNFGNFNETYGSLAAVVLLLLWLFIASFIVVMGAEVDSEMERQTFKDSTTGGKEPLGNREAQAADTVGASSS